MGRRAQQRQEPIWIAHTELPQTVAHPFYERLDQVLEERGFDAFVEQRCAGFYAERMGRPSLAPGRYFRLLLMGYFEGIDSERGMAWRAADSLSLRSFLGVGLEEMPPDHSTISRTRRLIDVPVWLVRISYSNLSGWRAISESLVGGARSLRGTTEVTWFTGVSLSSNAVPGSSPRGTMNPRATTANPRMRIAR